MLLDENLVRQLSRLDGLLVADRPVPRAAELRRLLEERVGRLEKLAPLSPAEAAAWFGGRSLAAVDGSVNGLGGAFPYLLQLFQALCKTSHGERTVASEVFSPLMPGVQARIDELTAQGLPREAALRLLSGRRLSALELQVARRAIREYRPRLVLFDGGFMRYLRHAPEEWEKYCALALELDVLSVGVIEEVASFQLAGALGSERDETAGDGAGNVFSPPGDVSGGDGRPGAGGSVRPIVYDRELLFGVLAPGECLFVRPEVEVKNAGLYTVFARLSRHPGAVAVDFLCEQAGAALQIMRYLYTITPSGGRGIPLFLDLVDAEVRLTHREIGLLTEACLDPAVRECFFTARRERRDY